MVGFRNGATITIKKGLNLAKGFVNVSVEVNEDRIYRAIFMEENRISTCFPPLT